jgi:acetyl-CoA carboxylase carboxyl transferase subunit alpha
VISPESCSSILWRSWDFKEKAAEALKLTSSDMKANGLVDEIINEPLNGAHRDHAAIFDIVKQKIKSYISELQTIEPETRINQRIDKFCKMGVWK